MSTAALALLAASGCTWGEPPATVLIAASPSQLTRGVTAVLRVTGRDFVPPTVVDFDDPDRSTVCAAVRVELRATGQATVALTEARLVSATELRARIPGDAAKDIWDVVVIDAAGREAAIGGALEVVNCPMTPPNSACDDGEPCTFDATRDPEDRCTGAAVCAGEDWRADGTPCSYECTTGESVSGACGQGRCLPLPGLCTTPPICVTP